MNGEKLELQKYFMYLFLTRKISIKNLLGTQ